MKKPLLLILCFIAFILIGTYFYNTHKKIDGEYRTDSNFPAEDVPVVQVTSTTTTNILNNPSAITSSSSRVRGPEDINIGIGEVGFTTGAEITLHEVINDYRCSKDAECSESGSIVVNVTIGVDGEKITTNLSSDETPFEFHGYAFSIIKISPDVYTGKTIDKADYRITFRIASAMKGDTI